MNANQHFMSMLQSQGEEERLQGLKGLAASGAEACMPFLYAAFGDESWRVRKEAAGIFLSLPRSGELAGEIVELLHSPDNAGLRNVAVEILTSLGRRAVPALLDEVECGDREVRKFVLDILGEIGSPAAVPALISALQDPDENVRAAAAENLGKLRSLDAVPALLESLKRPELLFRFTVLESLGRIGVPIPAEALDRFWQERLLRKAIVDCLGRTGGAASVPLLVEAIGDRMRNVRESAVLALGRLGRERPGELKEGLAGTTIEPAAEKLNMFLESGSPELRQAALHLVPYLATETIVHRLLPLLQMDDLREDAVRALIAVGQAKPELLTELWPQADDRTRVYLAYLYGQGACTAAGCLLLEGLRSQESDLRALSAQALGRVGGSAAIGPLMEALRDSVPEVKEAALHSLRSLSRGSEEAFIPLLQPLLAAEEPEQRMFAVLLFAALEGRDAEEKVFLGLKDESPLVRRAAVRAFEGKLDARHFSSLILALTDEDAEVRRLTVELFGATGDPLAAKPLELALRDEDPWVRAAAVRALGRLLGETAWLQPLLNDPVGLVAIAALEVAAEKKGPDAPSFLLRGLSHADEEVIRAALQLLPLHGDSDWMKTVRGDLLHHPHREVRLAAIRFLADCGSTAARVSLEERLVVEGDELLRQDIRNLLAEIGS